MKVKVIHLTHTDLGYKDTQPRINSQLRNDLHSIVTGLEKNPDSKWIGNAECFGTIYDAVNQAPAFEKRLANQIRNKRIGLSASFGNFSKIAGQELLDSSFQRYRLFCDRNKLENFCSLITNDINGYARSWAKSAFCNGIRYLFFGLHTHHGMFPAWRKQYPFGGELEKGKKVLVGIGEQYAIGNDLGISPGPMGDYIVQDGKWAGDSEEEQIKLSCERMEKYIEELKKSGYPLDIVPVTVLGHGSDDDPPNFIIENRLEILAKRWKKIGVESVQMCTIDEFFASVSEFGALFPIYKGEGPDWWTDGVGSMPSPLKAFREAQRCYKTVKRMNFQKKNFVPFERLEDDLLRFSEHTFGSEDTIRFPHSLINFTIENIKRKYAFAALESSQELLSVLSPLGNYKGSDALLISLEINNPFNVSVWQRINITKGLGIRESERFSSFDNVSLRRSDGLPIFFTIESIGHPVVESGSAKQIGIHTEMKALSKVNVILDMTKSRLKTSDFTKPIGGLPSDLVYDTRNKLIRNNNPVFFKNIFSNKVFKVIFSDDGISDIVLIQGNRSVLNGRGCFLRPLYIVDPESKDRNSLFLARRKNGRNRFGELSTRHGGKLIQRSVFTKDSITKVTLLYEVRGTTFYELSIEFTDFSTQFYAEVRLNKNVEGANESLLILLPFEGKLYLDYDSPYEPFVDQLPGSLVDYHSIQEGMSFGHTYVAQLDSALIGSGDLNFGTRPLAGQGKTPGDIFTWALNNAGETNFPVDTSGFHCFRYIVDVCESNLCDQSEKLLALSSVMPLKRLH